MHSVPPDLNGPTYYVDDDPTKTAYQLSQTPDGTPIFIVRYTLTPEERAAIAAGFDIFLCAHVTEHPCPPLMLHTGSPLADAPPLPATDLIECRGGAKDGDLLTALQALDAITDESFAGYTLVRVEDFSDGKDGARSYRILHDDSHDFDDHDDDDDDPAEQWKRGGEYNDDDDIDTVPSA